jgi:hypothetical protein
MASSVSSEDDLSERPEKGASSTRRKPRETANKPNTAKAGTRGPSGTGRSGGAIDPQRKARTAWQGDGAEGIDDSNENSAAEGDIAKEVGLATTTILDAFQRQFHPTHEEIEDHDLRRVVEKLQVPIDKLPTQAIKHLQVPLRLDDLFEVVIQLTPQAKQIDAVDLEIDRWMSDTRARRYFAKNLLALQQGAKISRVYVISPHVTEMMMNDIEHTLIRHLAVNNDDAVKITGGHLDIAVMYHEDLPDPHSLRDFAIFDKTKVLFEDFNAQWATRFKGQLTKDPIEVQENENYFNEMWNNAEALGSPSLVKEWTARTRARISRQGFEKDVFLGYSSAGQETATAIKDFIHESGYTVRDWKKFFTGPPLLKEIDNACKECQLGLFLFTGDELIPGKPPAPRDNVVFELGYFMSRKGDERVVGIWEKEVKQPTDLKGNIWIELADRKNISTIQTSLLEWLKKQLGPPPGGTP